MAPVTIAPTPSHVSRYSDKSEILAGSTRWQQNLSSAKTAHLGSYWFGSGSIRFGAVDNGIFRIIWQWLYDGLRFLPISIVILDCFHIDKDRCFLGYRRSGHIWAIIGSAGRAFGFHPKLSDFLSLETHRRSAVRRKSAAWVCVKVPQQGSKARNFVGLARPRADARV